MDWDLICPFRASAAGRGHAQCDSRWCEQETSWTGSPYTAQHIYGSSEVTQITKQITATYENRVRHDPNDTVKSETIETVLLYDQPFSRYKVVENRKCTEWPQNDLNHLTVERTLYTMNTTPQGPNFTPFRSTTRRFREARLSQIGNAPMTPEWP